MRALARLIDFTGRRVLEVGSGEGRLTWRYARAASSVLGIDPEPASVEAARAATPADLTERVSFRVHNAEQLDEPAGRFDVAFLAWSL